MPYAGTTPPAGVAPPPYAYPPASPGTDGLAIASLVTGILGLALIPLGLGIAALVRIKRSRAGGRGMAIAGIVLGALGTLGWTTLIVLGVVVAGSEDLRESIGEGYVEGFNDSTGYDVGVCFDPEASDLKARGVVDCATPHAAEVIGVQLMTDDEYPGDAQVEAAAAELCFPAFAEYVGIDYESSSLDMMYLYPVEETWAVGDRQIVCYATTLDGAPLEGSVKGTAQ